jgi:hypothetical protein
LKEKCEKRRGEVKITQRRMRLYLMLGKKVLCIVWRKLELAITIIAKGLMAAPLGRGFYTPLEAQLKQGHH